MKRLFLPLLGVLACLCSAQVHSGPPGRFNHGVQGVPVDPKQLLPLTDYWLADDYANLSKDPYGLMPLFGDGDVAGSWKSEMLAARVASDTIGHGSAWRRNKFGNRAAVCFAGGFGDGFRGKLPLDFSDGATIIVLGRLTGSIPYRDIVSVSGDTTTNPGDEDPNGFSFETRDPGNVLAFSHRANHVWTGALISSPFTVGAPGMWVSAMDLTIPNASRIAGYSDGSGVMTLGLSGGPPEAVYSPSDQSPILPQYLSIGCGTSTYWSAPVDISAVFVCSRRVTPEELQDFYARWVEPYYGAGVFDVKSFLPRSGFTRGCLHGPGLNVDFSKVPLDDFAGSFGFRWVRITLPPAPSDAAIDELIDYYLGNGIPIDWLLPSTVSQGPPPAFESVVPLAQQVCRRMTAKGYARPFFELGNECIQLHIPPLSHDFLNEYSAESGFATWLNQFMLGMAGYDYLVCGCNDEPIYTWRSQVQCLLKGTRMPDVWGIHSYSTSNGVAGANMPGTQQVLEEWMATSVVNTEGGFTAPYASMQQCVDYFCAMYANMGDLPWCYYTAGNTAWNPSNYGYPLYSEQTWDGNEVGTWTKYTPTATAIAQTMGFSLPHG
ncbi:MAG TPA: hypothetical protein VHE55_03620 [Fimbriimonadaceae bacterium]|nr:hypothetical protein [Fimbriimonadaceae bacterium]